MSDKFVGSPAGVVVSQCLLCRNRALGGGFVHCPAFPGGVPDAVVPGVTGWLAEPGDTAALGGALRDALALDDSERAAMSRRCIEKMRDEFPADRERSGYETIYAGLPRS